MHNMKKKMILLPWDAWVAKKIVEGRMKLTPQQRSDIAKHAAQARWTRKSYLGFPPKHRSWGATAVRPDG